MFNRSIKPRSLAVIVLLALFVLFPTQPSKASPESCAVAQAEAAAAEATALTICGYSGWNSPDCVQARRTAAKLVAAANSECE